MSRHFFVAGEETEAWTSERSLTREERSLVQIALRWEGVYSAAIDADFGPGTRRAMAACQQASGFEPTGVPTTKQRSDLIAAYSDAVSALDMRPCFETTAGIGINLPFGLVGFDRYEPPFAHLEPTTDDGLDVALLALVEPSLQSEIAVPGCSFGGVLTAPPLMYGTFSDVNGLDGDAWGQHMDVMREAGNPGCRIADGRTG